MKMLPALEKPREALTVESMVGLKNIDAPEILSCGFS